MVVKITIVILMNFIVDDRSFNVTVELEQQQCTLNSSLMSLPGPSLPYRSSVPGQDKVHCACAVRVLIQNLSWLGGMGVTTVWEKP